MACTAGCANQNCGSYGACLRSKSVRVGWANSTNGLDATKEKKWNAELDAYSAARKQGIQPAGTSMAKINEAVRLSDMSGVAFNAETARA